MSTTPSFLVRTALVLTCIALSMPAAAQTTVVDPASFPEQDRAARGLFDAGTLAFREGRYEAALHHFEEAYRLSQRPLLLFNIASSFDRLRRDQEALATFERYLEELPEAPNHQAVEARVTLLRQAVEEEQSRASQLQVQAETQAATHPEAETPEASAEGNAADAPKGSRNGLPPTVFWIGVGVTGVMAGVATWSGIDTIGANDDYLDAPTKAAYDDAHGRQSRTNVLIGLSAGLAAVTVVLALLTDWGGEDAPPPAQAWINRDGAGLLLSGEL